MCMRVHLFLPLFVNTLFQNELLNEPWLHISCVCKRWLGWVSCVSTSCSCNFKSWVLRGFTWRVAFGFCLLTKFLNRISDFFPLFFFLLSFFFGFLHDFYSTCGWSFCSYFYQWPDFSAFFRWFFSVPQILLVVDVWFIINDIVLLIMHIQT